jgi:hypothetical protein
MSKDLIIIDNEQELILREKKAHFRLADLMSISIAPFSISILGFLSSILGLNNGAWLFEFLATISGELWVSSLVLAAVGFLFRKKDITFSRSKIAIRADEDYIIIEDKLTLKEKNDPWKRQTRYATFTKNIDDIYIITSQGRRRIYEKCTHYEIWIERFGGQHLKVLGKEKGVAITNRSEAEFIVKKIQGFLLKNIKHKPKTTPKWRVLARQITKEQELSELRIQDLRKGALLDYKLQTWEVTEQIQYDWGQGNTDTLYCLENAENHSILLLVTQDLGIYQTWIEERLSRQELVSHNLEKAHAEAPLELSFKGNLLVKQAIETGYKFVGDSEFLTRVEQYKYLSEDGKHSLRTLRHENGKVLVFSGTKAGDFEFSNILIA